MSLTKEALAECLRVLELLVAEPTALTLTDEETRNRLMSAAGRVSRPTRAEQKLFSRAANQKKKQAVREADTALLQRTGIRRLREAPVFVTPDPELAQLSGGGKRGIADALPSTQCLEPLANAEAQSEAASPNTADSYEEAALANAQLSEARNCYVCKQRMDTLHFFYDQMCNTCGDFNYQKRSQTADLRGRVALISGARVKIGYQAAILLLRAGARVIVTTRFPRDAALRYAREKDFALWQEQLQIYGLDLRHTPSVETFARHLTDTLDSLDFVLHNACQTVRRPVGFYQHLMNGEHEAVEALPAGARSLLRDYETLRNSAPQLHSGDESLATPALGLLAAPALSQVKLTTEDNWNGGQLFPAGQLDADLQQVDLRTLNSWRLTLDQVSTVELLEVQLVNAIAPFVLNAKLRPLMTKRRSFDKHIVNVSAMEGQFYRRFKTDKHPHTNMAKAALNMMTRTSAPDYLNDGIHMNSVDTGWVTDEDVAHIAERKTRETGFQPPLDIVDGAARIVDPIFDGLNTGKHVWGQFLKDYRATTW